MTKLADGDRVRVSFTANGKHSRFGATVEDGRMVFKRLLPASQRRLSTGIMEIRYGGNDRVRPTQVRLRAASREARLRRHFLSLHNGVLTAEGSLADGAKGVVRLILGYARPSGTLGEWQGRASIRDDGSWRLEQALPADARAGGYLSVQYTGYRPRRIRGEQLAKELLAGQSFGVAAQTRKKRAPVVGPVQPAPIPAPAPAPTPTPAPEPTTAPVDGPINPLAGQKLYVDPFSHAQRQAKEWRATRPLDAAQMDKIAAQPRVDWFGGWNTDITTDVAKRVATISAAGARPVLVAYNIPLRDCGGYSAGGASSPDAYRAWIRGLAAGIGSASAVVILEPDALASLGCLSAADRETRLDLLRDAVSVLASKGSIATYIDAGHSAWHSAPEMAKRLNAAGVAGARGFALNVSNFRWTDGEVDYGRTLSTALGGKHFVVDTSRNGLGPASDNEWCNPSGRALGPRPTTATSDPLADAYLWIKAPGESDGTCNGGPKAGGWWADYALGLAQRAGL